MKIVSLDQVKGDPKVDSATNPVDYLKLKFSVDQDYSTGDGKYIEEISVSEKGKLWTGRLYPNGLEEDPRPFRYMSLELKANFRIRAQVTIRVNQGFNLPIVFQETAHWNLGFVPIVRFIPKVDPFPDPQLSVLVSIERQDTVWFPEPAKPQPFTASLYHCREHFTDLNLVVEESVFSVHSPICSQRAPRLLDLAKQSDDGKTVRMDAMTKDQMEIIIKYIYAVEDRPVIQDMESARSLILHAKKYEIGGLALWIEPFMVALMREKQAPELFLFSFSNDLAYLEEACMDVFVRSPKTYTSSEFWTAIIEKDLLQALLLPHLSRANHLSQVTRFESSVRDMAQRIINAEDFDLSKSFEAAFIHTLIDEIQPKFWKPNDAYIDEIWLWAFAQLKVTQLWDYCISQDIPLGGDRHSLIDRCWKHAQRKELFKTMFIVEGQHASGDAEGDK